MGFRHEPPQEKKGGQGQCCDAEKPCRRAEAPGTETFECGTERSADPGYRSEEPLREIESAGTSCEVGDCQRREHAQHRSADSVQQLSDDENRWIGRPGKHQPTERQCAESTR